MSYPIKLVIYAILVGKRIVLVDAGCDTLPGLPLLAFVPPAEALEKAGIAPDKVTDVIITHAHHDHIDGLRHFPNAEVYIQEDEYRQGRKYIPERNRVRTFSECCLVAGCLTVRRIGGHSVGSCIVKLDQNGKKYVFCGDECYLRASLEGRMPVGGLHPEISRAFVRTYGGPEYRVLLSHDPEVETGPVE